MPDSAETSEYARILSEETSALNDLVDRFPDLEVVVKEAIDAYGDVLPNLIFSDIVRWMAVNTQSRGDICMGILGWMEEQVLHGSDAVSTMVVVSGVEMIPDPGEPGDELRHWMGAALCRHDPWLRLSPAETAWVDAARRACDGRGLPLEFAPEDWCGGMEKPCVTEGRCLAWMDMMTADVYFMSAGGYFDGTKTVIGPLDNQTFTPNPTDTRVPQQSFTGTIEEQAKQAIQWLDWLVHRPLERLEWSDICWEIRFADTAAVVSFSGPKDGRQGPPRLVGASGQILRLPLASSLRAG